MSFAETIKMSPRQGETWKNPKNQEPAKNALRGENALESTVEYYGAQLVKS